MNYEDAGANKAVKNIFNNINRRWFYNYLQFILRYSGFFLLGIIVYFQVLFTRISYNWIPLLIWIITYLLYLSILEILRRLKVSFYDKNWFVLIRIISNIILISWLLHDGPLARDFLSFAFLIPFISITFYFPKYRRWNFFVFALAVIGLTVGSYLLDSEYPLEFWQLLVITFTMGILFLCVQFIYTSFLNVPEGLLERVKRLQAISGIGEIVEEISEGIQVITDAESMFILIAESDHNIYITHKSIGIELNQSIRISDLIENCEYFTKGIEIDNDDIRNTSVEEYFSKYFATCLRSIFIEPIRGKGNYNLGFIIVGSQYPHKFNILTKRFIKQFCTSAALAIENCILLRKTRLKSISQKPNPELLYKADSELEISQILADQTTQSINNADGCVIHIVNDQSDKLIPIAGIKSMKTGEMIPWIDSSHINNNPIQRTTMKIGTGIAGHALHYGEIISVPNVEIHPWFEPGLEGNNISSLIAAPLINPANNFKIGTITIYSKQKSVFTEEDETRLAEFARQGVSSIVRVREFEDWRLKGGILKNIFESALKINYEGDRTNVCQQLAKMATDILPFGMVRIRILDNTTGDLITKALYGFPEKDKSKLYNNRLPYELLKPFLKEEYRVERSYLIPANAHSWKEFAESNLYIPTSHNEHINKSWDNYDAFFTPLISEKENLLGYISWDQPADGGRPSQEIIEAVGAFAGMASWSIELTQAHHRIDEQRTLIKSFIALTTEEIAKSSDISVVGEIAVNLGKSLLNTEACSLFLVNNTELILSNSTYLKGPIYIGRRKPILACPGSGLSSWVAATKKHLCFNSEAEYKEHPGWAKETRHLKFLDSGKCESILLVPILDKSDSCLGVLSFENKNPDENDIGFSDIDLELSTNLADGIGLAIGLTEQFKNVKTWEQETLQIDLHDLKNFFLFGISARIDNAYYYLINGNRQKVEENLNILMKRSSSFLDELYSLHNTVEKKYYQIPKFRDALEQLVEKLLLGDERLRKKDLSMVKVECPDKIKLTPLLRYVFIRITSEALLNSIKHSGFLHDQTIGIKVIVKQKDENISLIVRDSGIGRKKIEPGYGIKQMRGLIRNLKKKGIEIDLRIHSIEGHGTEVKISAKNTFKEE
jgi:two-component sensor histidine kinase/GAF domain-containing protein